MLAGGWCCKTEAISQRSEFHPLPHHTSESLSASLEREGILYLSFGTRRQPRDAVLAGRLGLMEQPTGGSSPGPLECPERGSVGALTRQDDHRSAAWDAHSARHWAAAPWQYGRAGRLQWHWRARELACGPRCGTMIASWPCLVMGNWVIRSTDIHCHLHSGTGSGCSKPPGRLFSGLLR